MASAQPIESADRVRRARQPLVGGRATRKAADVVQAKDTVVTHFMKSLGLALGMLSLSWVGGLATANEATQGRALFMQYCASCHGPNGAGNVRSPRA